MEEYTAEDITRMKYYYKELKCLRLKHPNSLPLINGMAHIEKVCNLPQVTKSVDFSTELDRLIEAEKVKAGLKPTKRWI